VVLSSSRHSIRCKIQNAIFRASVSFHKEYFICLVECKVAVSSLESNRLLGVCSEVWMESTDRDSRLYKQSRQDMQDRRVCCQT